MIVAPLTELNLPFHFDAAWQLNVLTGALGRLIVACILGGIVGVEREISRKSAGVRTNILICFGSALFTLLSEVLAGDGNPNKGQVAANIVQGIGFLGAGLIIRDRGRISGLATAASVWVVASIGMACGAGLYGAAVVSAGIVIVSLEVVGSLERRANLKRFSIIYEARGADAEAISAAILAAYDALGERLDELDTGAVGAMKRVTFDLNGTTRQHAQMRAALAGQASITQLLTFRDPEDD